MKVNQPYNPKILFHFTYDIETRIVEQDEALVKEYDMQRFYYNMPEGFSDTNVIEEDREIYNDMYRRLDEGENYATADFRVTSDLHWARVTIYRESPGASIFQGVVQDVSEQYNWIVRQAEQRELEQLRLRSKELESLQLLRAISDTYDMIVSVNLTQNHYYYYSYEHFINQEVEEGVFDEVINYHAGFVSDDHRETYLNTFSRKALIKAYKEGKKSVYLEYQQADDAGELHWLATHTMFMDNPYGDDILEITISQNIDERVRKEKENQLIIKDALLSAERANDAKSDFLSRMSHDIRTPMNAIIGMTTIAAAQIDDKEKVKECLTKIGTSSRFLLGLVNDILDISKIESGKMSISSQVFPIRELLDSLVTAAASLAGDKQQNFCYKLDNRLPEFYKGDRLRIEQIFLNLLGNAHKFTPENGEIMFTVEVAGHSENRDVLKFTVEDNGIGIKEEFMEKLFDPFAQDEEMKNHKGSGLGLAIVQNLLHLMDGTIRVYSRSGEGSRFIVELPLELPEKEELDPRTADDILDDTMIRISETTNQQLHNRGTSQEIMFHGENVLLVEDNEFNQEVGKTILEMHNLNVEIASDGYEAVEKFTNSKPGQYVMIFMDIQMPGIDGYETTRRIRKSEHEEAATIPIYAMTANAFATDVSAAKQHGMNGHIAKPVDFDVVAQILFQYLSDN